MAHINEKTGDLELTYEDKEALTGFSRNKKRVQELMNYIIWGDNEHFYDKKYNR